MTSQIDLNSILLFYEVVNAGSITQAAARLRMPKSTVSRKMTLLEQQMGVMLLRKSTRKLHATDIGANFYDHCELIVKELENAQLETSEMHTGLRGTLSVAMPTDVGVAWLAKVICDFSKVHPEVQFEIELSKRPIDLIEERYDIAIHLGPLLASRLVSKPIGQLRRGIYASPEYLEQHGVPTSVTEFSTRDCVLTELQRSEGVWSFKHLGQHHHVEILSKVIVNNTALARELVMGGMGIGILPSLMCLSAVDSGRLVRLLTDWEAPSLQAHAVFLDRVRIPQRTRVFLDFLAMALASDDERVHFGREVGLVRAKK